MKKILYVISNSRIGGAETLLARLVERLDRKKFEPHVIVTDAIGPFHDRYQKAAVSYHYLATVPNKRAAIASYARGKGIDVIHVVNHIEMWSLAALSAIPVVASLYMDLAQPGGFADHWLPKARAAMQSLAGFVTDHEANLDALPPGPHVSVIKGGVDVKQFKPASKTRPKTVAWVGRLSEGKGADLLVPLATAMPDHSFTAFVSEPGKFLGPDVAKHAPPNLRLVAGATDAELAAALRRHRTFLSTSRSEGSPVSVMEGMASGCCPVARAVGGLPALMAGGVNGILYAEDAGVEGIAEAIRLARPRIGAAAAKAARAFSLQSMAKQHEDLYSKLC